MALWPDVSGNDINGLNRIWIVSIGVKEKPSTWEGNILSYQLTTGVLCLITVEISVISVATPPDRSACSFINASFSAL